MVMLHHVMNEKECRTKATRTRNRVFCTKRCNNSLTIQLSLANLVQEEGEPKLRDLARIYEQGPWEIIGETYITS